LKAAEKIGILSVKNCDIIKNNRAISKAAKIILGELKRIFFQENQKLKN